MLHYEDATLKDLYFLDPQVFILGTLFLSLVILG